MKSTHIIAAVTFMFSASAFSQTSTPVPEESRVWPTSPGAGQSLAHADCAEARHYRYVAIGRDRTMVRRPERPTERSARCQGATAGSVSSPASGAEGQSPKGSQH
jgi:hypothetical protein